MDIISYLLGKKAGGGGGTVNLESKEVTITTNTTTEVTPSEGYDGLSKATITVAVPPLWSNIGYTECPETIINDFNYSKNIYDNWSNPNTLYEYFKGNTTLKYMPAVDTSNSTNNQSTFEGCSNLLVVPDLNLSNTTSILMMFKDCTKLEKIGNITTSNSVSNVNGLFYHCESLTELPIVNLGVATGMFAFAEGCTSIVTFPLFDTKNIQNFDGACIGCTSLVNVPVLDVSKVNDVSNMFQNCLALSDESLDNILQMSINMTSVYPSNRKKLSRWGITDASLTSRISSLPHYQAFISSGWTIS